MENKLNREEYRSSANAHQQASFSLRNRLARALWNFMYTFFFYPSPRVFHKWRAWLLRLWGAKIGKNCHIYPKTKIWCPWKLECEDNVAIADTVILYNQATIQIGEGTVVSQGSHLCTGTHDYENVNFPLVARPITIGKKVWICAEVFILPGICIEDGTVIAARSVVSKNMPAWSVCGGHPCKVIKKRVLRFPSSDKA